MLHAIGRVVLSSTGRGGRPVWPAPPARDRNIRRAGAHRRAVDHRGGL